MFMRTLMAAKQTLYFGLRSPGKSTATPTSGRNTLCAFLFDRSLLRSLLLLLLLLLLTFCLLDRIASLGNSFLLRDVSLFYYPNA